MSGMWNTNVSVRIDEGCSMQFRVHSKDVVEFRADGDRNEFDMSFEVDALKQFLQLGARAVSDADALHLPNHEPDAGVGVM